jgi:hypothetical protein
MRKERVRLSKSLKKAVPSFKKRQLDHLILCWRKNGKARVLTCFNNWELDNLERISVLKVLRESAVKPGTEPFLVQEEDKDEPTDGHHEAEGWA